MSNKAIMKFRPEFDEYKDRPRSYEARERSGYRRTSRRSKSLRWAYETRDRVSSED